MENFTSIEGPVEMFEGNLALLIPLEAGGEILSQYTRGIGEVDGDFLRIIIPPFLAENLGLTEGSMVTVDNADDKFNIYPQVFETEP